MKKLIILGIVSLFGTFLFVACSTSAPSLESQVRTIEKEGMTQKKVHATIERVCEENSWHTTEFKFDTLIAEKFDGDNTKSVTIKFNKDSFYITPANSDLGDAIEKALSN